MHSWISHTHTHALKSQTGWESDRSVSSHFLQSRRWSVSDFRDLFARWEVTHPRSSEEQWHSLHNAWHFATLGYFKFDKSEPPSTLPSISCQKLLLLLKSRWRCFDKKHRYLFFFYRGRWMLLLYFFLWKLKPRDGRKCFIEVTTFFAARQTSYLLSESIWQACNHVLKVWYFWKDRALMEGEVEDVLMGK